jgi:hypothetical protein
MNTDHYFPCIRKGLAKGILLSAKVLGSFFFLFLSLPCFFLLVLLLFFFYFFLLRLWYRL